jgi:hypothetical protein
MMRALMRFLSILLLCGSFGLSGCGTSQGNNGDDDSDFSCPWQPTIVRIDFSNPILVGTTFSVAGEGFTLCGQNITVEIVIFGGNLVHPLRIPALIVSDSQILATINGNQFAGLENQQFMGQATVEFLDVGNAVAARSNELQITLTYVRELIPQVGTVGDVSATLYKEVQVTGSNLLLPSEGSSAVQLRGIMELPDGSQKNVEVEVPLEVNNNGGRNSGTFLFVPEIGGIEPGTLVADLKFVNRATEWTRISETVNVQIDLLPSYVIGWNPTSTTLGGIVTISGGGFIGRDSDETFYLHFSGTVTPRGGAPVDLDGDLFPVFIDGETASYSVIPVARDRKLISENFGIQTGTLNGSVTPVLLWGQD